MASSSLLSVESVHRTMDEVLASLSSSSLDGEIVLRPIRTPSDWNSIRSFSNATATANPSTNSRDDEWNEGAAESASLTSTLDVRTPFYFGIQALDAEETAVVVGFCTFYIAYSTWDGRMLYADQIHKESNGSLLLYHILAKIATKLGCGRFTWKQNDRPKWNLEKMPDPEHLEDWIFLSMDRPAMANFVGQDIPNEGSAVQPIQDTIQTILEEEEQQQQPHPPTTKSGAIIQLRLAQAEDTETIERLVQGLADYEKEPDAVQMTAHDYFRDGFSGSDPLFYCILADVITGEGENDPKTVAMGFFYLGHDLAEGPFLYLEDLFCEEAYRKQGIGSHLMKQLSKICLELNCNKLVWVALDWNTPALDFYQSIGATLQTEPKITRYCGADLESFARSNE